MKKLLVWFLGLFGLQITKEKAKEVQPTVFNTPVVKSTEELMDEIRHKIITEGYKEIPNILAEYEHDVVAHWVKLQEIALGEFDNTNNDNDSLTFNELIDRAVEINRYQYEKAMRDRGLAGVTEGQLALIKRLSEEAGAEVEVPKDKFEASRIIEDLNTKLGRKVRTGDDKPTDAQMRKLDWICKQLNVAMPTVKNIREASEQIQVLQKVYDTKIESGAIQPLMATEPQMAYMQRLYKASGKRWIKTSANKFAKMTRQEMSKAIEEMKERVSKDHPEINKISKGQVNYLISLLSQLGFPYSLDDINSMSKQSATKKIDELKRHLLFVLSKGSLEKKEIAKMQSTTIDSLLKNLRMEKRTEYYTDTPDNVDSKYATV